MEKKINEPEKVLRSLLQKAVRRGNIEITRKAAAYLVKHDDFDWVRKRLAAIVFEECWTYAGLAGFEKDPDAIIRHYLNMACTVKNKDAAGLGSFAFSLSEGDTSFSGLLTSEEFKQVRFTAEAIKSPDKFWLWVQKETQNDFQKNNFINKAFEAFKKVNWPWDKAFIIAGALFTAAGELPKTRYKKTDLELPLWVGADKHTPIGRAAIKRVAAEKNIDEEKAMLISFYFEGALMNNALPSAWWEKEVNWKITGAGLAISEAEKIWQKMRGRLAELLREESEKISQKLDSVDGDGFSNQQQMGLF